MANANLKPSIIASERFITIEETARYQPFTFLRTKPSPAPIPRIRLIGRWLEHAGFEPRQRVRVQVSKGKLVITLASAS